MAGRGDRLLFNEAAYNACPPEKKEKYFLFWMSCLIEEIPSTNDSALLKFQEKLLDQLISRIQHAHCLPNRKIFSFAILKVLSLDLNFPHLNDTISYFNKVLKETSPVNISPKLTAVSCLAALFHCIFPQLNKPFEKHMSVLMEESFSLLIEWLRTAQSDYQVEILNTVLSMIIGLGSENNKMHKKIYKVIKSYVNDKAPSVRIAALRCLAALVPAIPYMYINDWDQLFTSCFKAACSSYDVGKESSTLLATVIATVLEPPSPNELEQSAMDLESLSEKLKNYRKLACKALKPLPLLFSQMDMSTPFGKILTEDVFMVMKTYVSKIHSDMADDQLIVLQEVAKYVESYAQIADEDHLARIVALLTRSLCRLLLSTAAEEGCPRSLASKSLKDYAVERLKVVDSTWSIPVEFKCILTGYPELKEWDSVRTAKEDENEDLIFDLKMIDRLTTRLFTEDDLIYDYLKRQHV